MNVKLISLLFIIALTSCGTKPKKWAGQAPIQKVSTATKPTQPQWKGVFTLGDGLYASNDFTGARLNGIVRKNDTLITALITAENTPINPSPWYAFQLWAETEKEVTLELTYSAGVRHRYYPKLSKDGKNWESIAKNDLTLGPVDLENNRLELPNSIKLKLTIGPEKVWVSAQELMTSEHNSDWVGLLAKRPYVSKQIIGNSRQARPLELLQIGDSKTKKAIFVLSRQHPPEVTGYLAMRSFVETIAADTELAKNFRSTYTTYVVPMANPDGVDNGHWRHSTAGIDLNRDWEAGNQPEVKAVRNFMEAKTDQGSKFYFAVDFHSTWEDIYYTIDPAKRGNMPGLVPAMINGMQREIPSLEPNIRPNTLGTSHVTSSAYFFHTFAAESLTYEIGDNTPRDLLKRKGEISARELMRLMLEKSTGY